MTEIATIDWSGRWGTPVFSENTAIFYIYIQSLFINIIFYSVYLYSMFYICVQ